VRSAARDCRFDRRGALVGLAEAGFHERLVGVGNALRKGSIFLMEYFWDHAEALETVGLSAAMSQERP
jgi:hypothetical protein